MPSTATGSASGRAVDTKKVPSKKTILAPETSPIASAATASSTRITRPTKQSAIPIDIRKTEQYRLASRRWLSTIVALPIFIYTSWALYERVYSGKSPKQLLENYREKQKDVVDADDTEAITTLESGASSTSGTLPASASISTSVSASLTSKVEPESQFASVGLQSSSFQSEKKEQADRKKGWFYFF